MENLTKENVSRIIEMAWEDRTPFEAIKKEFNLNESKVIKIMRQELNFRSFKLWRKRVSGRKLSIYTSEILRLDAIVLMIIIKLNLSSFIIF